jgi:hypothetical protein
VAHGNGPNGLAVVLAALNAMMRRALEAKIMERQAEATTIPAFLGAKTAADVFA